MLTRCPACLQCFHIAPEQVSAAYGLVRCGQCQSVFDARAQLRDQAPAKLDSAGEDDREQRLVHGQIPPRDETQKQEGAAMVPYVAARGQPGPWRALWWAALIMALLALALQLVHANRHTVAHWPGVGAAVADIYQAAGHPIKPRLELARYAIVGASLNSVRGNQGMLVLSGRLVNRAGFVQRLPLMRLQLNDRHGQAVDSRLLLPSDYGAATITHLSAGRGLSFHLTLVDPGARATGFELVLCKQRSAGVACLARR